MGERVVMSLLEAYSISASGLIEPGYHIQAVPLETVLPGGSYTATALFTAYDLETEQPAGQAAARVRITVAK